MSRVEWLVILISCGVGAVTSVCVIQNCSCRGTDIWCQYMDLTSVPPLSAGSTGLQHLHLDNNRITALLAGSLPPNLAELSLLNNPLAIMDPTVLDNSSNTLTVLSISGASLTRIPDAIGRLASLRSFTLYDTHITDWNVPALTNLSRTLRSLFLENVNLIKWPSWIQLFSNLTELSVLTSKVVSIPDHALDSLASCLLSLSITSSYLQAVPPALSNLTRLTNLQLDGNRISSLAWLPRSTALQQLSLSNNYILDHQHLSNSLRPLANSLTSVGLTHNQLSSLPDLSYLTRVGSLDFSFNQISASSLGFLSTHLYHLDFSSNALTSIPDVYQPLRLVKDMQLSSNFITDIQGSRIPEWVLQVNLDNNAIGELTDSSFPKDSAMTMLSLAHNPLSRVSTSAFRNLKNLKSLNLQDTKLARLPLALTSLVSLSYLDISKCADLVCTCQEKNLTSFINAMSTLEVAKCGLVTVEIFFKIFSSGCPSS